MSCDLSLNFLNVTADTLGKSFYGSLSIWSTCIKTWLSDALLGVHWLLGPSLLLFSLAGASIN